ncbi:MAG: NAD(P)/FAD-dependent oxidoreductase [Coriobacteriia bacterium]|nr:NAD(P)/FAD-dependent oxidoreductase [Coriobacteriia bacterium]
MPALTEYDVVVIGAGVVGCCAARELSRYDLRTVVLEAGLDIACGATRANSGIVHTGYDPEPGTLKAAYNVRGAALFPALQRELAFAYRKNGALVVAFSPDEVATLHELAERAQANGAPAVTVVDQAQLRELEPGVSPQAVAALHVPDSGICDPYGFALALAENAADNGVEFAFDARVASIQATDAGYQVTLADGTQLQARAVVNTAGAYSDEINNMVSARKLRIAPRRGEYHLFKEGVHAFDHTMFPVPTKEGKGILVGTAAFGNQFVGPNAVPQESRADVATTAVGLDQVMDQAARLWPDVAEHTVIANYAGIRATNAETGDFVIGPVEDAPGFFNAACIDSPGLASAPAIGADLASWVAEYLQAAPNPTFDPRRVPAPLLFMMDDQARERLIQEDPRFGSKICGCANVTEGEVVAALHRSIPVLCFEALKWRTGVTMGECQGGRCVPRILAVMAAELGVEPCTIPRRAAGSYLVSHRRCAVEVALPPKPNRVYEKPRSMYRIPGARAAGVFSAYGALCTMARTGYLPGETVLVWGGLDAADECAAELERAGAQVIRVRDGQVLRVDGDLRVEAVVIAAPDGTQTTYACDALIMSDQMLDHVPVRGH